MSNDLNDSQITKNLIIFFVVVAIVTVGLAYLGIYIQDSDYRKNIEIETRAVSYTHLTLPPNREV